MDEKQLRRIIKKLIYSNINHLEDYKSCLKYSFYNLIFQAEGDTKLSEIESYFYNRIMEIENKPKDSKGA